MARRNESILVILMQLPWWVSVITSALVYVGMTYIFPALPVENMFIRVFQQMTPNVAPQFALLFLLPAPFAALNSWRKRKRLDSQKNIQTIRDLGWKEFEELVAEAYRRKGFSVIENSQAGPDGGIDIRLTKNGQLHLVQCKNWRNQKVGVSVVREMYGVMTAENAASVIVVISGIFTQEAKNFAAGKPIDLVEGSLLVSMIRDVQTNKVVQHHEPVMNTVTLITPVIPEQQEEVASVLTSKICPQCGKKMVLRTAKRGVKIGQQFYGCSGYPGCRHIEPI